MGSIKLYFDVRDIFRAPRLALSGKKIWIFIVGNLGGFILYWIFSYLALALAGESFTSALAKHGLYPCLFGYEAEWYAWVTYFIGVEAWIIAIYLAATAVSRVTLKQLKGNDFFSAGDAWTFVQKHWHPVAFAPLSITLIIVFFMSFAGAFAFMGKIPYVGEFLFAVPYLFYFFGSVFTIYTAFVLLVSLHYTPAIVGTYEEDTMGTVFQSYSITWSQPWRVIAYHIVLIVLLIIAIPIFTFFWYAGYGLVNYVFACEWFMGGKLTGIMDYAVSLVCPVIPSVSGLLSGTESVAGVILAISLFLIGLSIFSYGLSIVSVAETIMFIVFKRKSDDDDLLERKDEDELEEDMDDDFNFDDNDDDTESDDSDGEKSDETSSEDSTDDSNSDSDDEEKGPNSDG
jgi:hypothetical protein|tara:strand:+ start:23734 stop:24933 length:1200 start_codon:yes stop_codon:yes gene_type:complete